MIEIKLFKKIELDGCTFLEGFPGTGLVGPMSISYMVNKLQLEYVGYIKSDLFPPLVSIHKDTPMPPLRFYYSKKNSLLLLFAESGPSSEKSIYEISDAIYNFLKEKKIKKIISISGIPTQNPNNFDVFAVASTKELSEKIQKLGLKPIGEGVAAGVSAVIMMNAAIDNIDDINILVQVNPQIIDPRYAEIAINSLNKLLNMNIDVVELDKEAKMVEDKVKELLKKSKETREGVIPESDPNMYT